MEGFFDFEVYYTAARALHDGLSPYSPEIISTLRIELSLSQRNLIFPYPPLLLVLIYPLGFFNYQTALALWILCSIVLFLFSAKIIWNALSPTGRSPLWSAYAFMASVPPLVALQFGQLCAVITFGVALLFSGLQKNKSLFVAGGLILMTLKHLLFYPLAPVVLFWIFVNRRWTTILWYFGSLATLLVFAEFLSPGCTVQWLGLRDAAFQILLESQNGTLSDSLQWLVLRLGGPLPIWPLIVCPMMGMLISTLYLLKTGVRKFDYIANMGMLLAISLTFSPYGWFFDYAVLSLAQVVWCHSILSSSHDRSWKIWKITTLTVFQLGILWLMVNYLSGLGDFWWYPFALVGLLRIGTACQKETSIHNFSR